MRASNPPIESAPKLVCGSLDVFTSDRLNGRKYLAYPNLKQSVRLVVLLYLIMLGLLLPLALLSGILDQDLHSNLYVNTFVTLVSFVLVIVYAQRRSGRPWSDILFFRTVPLKMCLPLLVSIIGMGIINFNIANFVQYLIPIPEVILNIFRDLMGRETPLAFQFYILVIQASLTEEVFFRGAILGGLLAYGTQNRAIFWSAFLFAVVHINPWQFPGALILGLVFAWWVVQTGSLLPALMGHALSNFLSLTSARLEIFGPMEDWDVVVFLPWWLFVCGIVLAVVGLRWFNQLAKQGGESVEAPADGESV